ncbi:MAG: glycerophosphodiester phosphodiesterase [Nitrospiraceae bacterium]|nr:glycerophosphodiester phosphodiesterase [Nitrospiraceae bacterium]
MFLRIGHRGAKAHETENTRESFGKAIEMGVNGIELDVRSSADGGLVVIHDDNLKRVYGKKRRVREATLRELKDLTGNRIMTLGEALRFVKGKIEKVLVELKEAGYEKKVLGVIGRERVKDRAIVVSFHEEVLSRVREADKKIETGLIYARYKNPVRAALALQAQYLLPLYRFVHARDIESAHENGLKVVVWTINSKKEAKKYIAKGVDGIASDDPDIFRGIA